MSIVSHTIPANVASFANFSSNDSIFKRGGGVGATSALKVCNKIRKTSAYKYKKEKKKTNCDASASVNSKNEFG